MFPLCTSLQVVRPMFKLYMYVCLGEVSMFLRSFEKRSLNMSVPNYVSLRGGGGAGVPMGKAAS